MQEAGFDLTHAKPQRLTEDLAGAARLLVTMGCGEACPFAPGVEREDSNLPDPDRQSLEQVRSIRGVVRDRVKDLVAARGWQRGGSP
jgi:arsenate reductase